MIKTRKINSSIDIMKFVCTILVIAIHTSPFREINTDISYGIRHIVARIAVPFFFISAGYFFTQKLTKCNNKNFLKDYLLKLLTLYVAYSMIYFLSDFINMLNKTKNITAAILEYSKNFVFIGSHFHLWFIPALMLAIVLLYTALYYKKIKLFLVIAIVLYLFGLFGDSYYGFIKNQTSINNVFIIYFKWFKTTRNGLFFGFLYVIMGGIIALNNYKTTRLKDFVFTFISLVLLIIEALFLRAHKIPRNYNMYIMLIPFIFFLLKFLIKTNIYLKEHISLSLRRYSMDIYFIHGIFLTFYTKAFNILEIKNINTIYFILVLASSIISIYFIKKLRIPILRYY